jgi:L-lysine 2,3-aminomutase
MMTRQRFVSFVLCCLVHTGLSFVVVTKETAWQVPRSSLRLKQDPNPNNEVDDQILDEILQVAIVASKNAGDIIQKNSGGADVVEKKSTSRDLLTLVDPQCEKVRACVRRWMIEESINHALRLDLECSSTYLYCSSLFLP